VRLHDFGELVAPGVLEHADLKHLVIFTVNLAEIGFSHTQLRLQAAARDLGVEPLHLAAVGAFVAEPVIGQVADIAAAFRVADAVPSTHSRARLWL
jgi:hypothetical protein